MIQTFDGVGVYDVGRAVEAYLGTSGVAAGFCILSLPYDNCGLTISDDVETLKSDLAHLTDRAPGRPLAIIDDDPAIAAPPALVAQSLTVPVQDRELYLGTWSEVLLLEAAGPRTVQIDLTLIGD